MIIHCSKCDINWAALYSAQVNEDEVIEYCPECLTDMYLEPGTDITAFTKCPFTGNIIDMDTGKIMDRKVPVYIPRIIKEKPAMTITQAEQERRDMAALDAYHASGNKEDFFNTYKNYQWDSETTQAASPM